MFGGRSAQRAARHVCLQCRAQAQHGVINRQAQLGAHRTYTTRTGAGTSSRDRLWIVFAASAGVGAALFGNRAMLSDMPNLEDGESVIEKRKKRRDDSKEANRDALSSQHIQVKQSWENPGVFVWGSNSGNVADPGSKDNVVKNPRRIAFFDGQLLRDLKLDRNFGAAIDEKGDLYIWGSNYSPEAVQPEKILTGKRLRGLAISQDRVFALSSGGQVYSVPVSKEDQLSGAKLYETSWIPFWPSKAKISYKILDLPNRSWGETITTVSSGLEHGLLLTSKGRLFSFASSSTAYPTRGQLGLPGVTSWDNRPAGPYDSPHTVAALKGFDVVAVATGDYHSLVLDSVGRVFGFGDNSSGQLGLDVTPESPYIDSPSLQNTAKLYSGSSQIPRITSIAAGGSVSFMTIDATRVASVNDDASKPSTRSQIGKVTADVWSFGQGIYGTLGSGRWTHIQGDPARIRSLSGLFEYDEEKRQIIPIRISHLSVGSTHAAAVLDNVTYVDATDKSGENDVNWGADVLWWGGNEHYQLGTGKRANVNVPTYIGPLEKVGDGSKRDAHRLHITPRKKVKINGRTVQMEQSIECGRMVSAVYSRYID